MPEVHTHMTALEFRFEEELAAVPGWHNVLDDFDETRSGRPANRKETKRDKAVEEMMVLGA